MFKTAEEKSAAREAAAQRVLRKEKLAQEARYRSSPLGRAATALAAGATVLQLILPVDDDGSHAISQIEAIGWQLQSVAFAFDLKLTSYPNGTGQLSSIDSASRPMGLYLFRRG